MSKLSRSFACAAAAMAQKLSTPLCIVGSGPAAHTAAIYAARAELQPILFEGWLANGVAAGGQLTTTTDVENFPGFPEGIMGGEITDKFRRGALQTGGCTTKRMRKDLSAQFAAHASCLPQAAALGRAQRPGVRQRRAQSEKFGTRIFSETVTKVDLSRRPFRLWTDEKEVEADTVIVATGARARLKPCLYVCNKLPPSFEPERYLSLVGLCVIGTDANSACQAALLVERNSVPSVLVAAGADKSGRSGCGSLAQRLCVCDCIQQGRPLKQTRGSRAAGSHRLWQKDPRV